MAVKLTHLQLIYGVAGAREKFEELVIHLIRSEHPNAERIRVVRGDGGIDAHDGPLADPEGVDVFQVKFFPEKIGESQQNQIRESFKRIHDNTDFRTKSWTLCIPIDMSIEEKKWLEEWKDKQRNSGIAGIDIRPVWDALRLENLLYEGKNRHIKEEFFKEEHLMQIREMHSTLEKLARDFAERVPKPVPLVLRPHLKDVRSRRTYDFDADFIVVEVELCFSVENVSSQSVSNWSVSCSINIPQDACLTRETFSKIGNGPSYIRYNSTILPTLQMTTEILFGLKIKRNESLESQVRQLLQPSTLTFKAISDNHVGEEVSVLVKNIINWDKLIDGMKKSLRKENIKSYDTLS